MTDGRFSGGSVGLVDRARLARGVPRRPIALIEDGDTITVDLNADRLDCRELDDPTTRAVRTNAWQGVADANRGIHPDATPVTSRVLQRMRATATPAILGAGMKN